jgi:hypothetical protein
VCADAYLTHAAGKRVWPRCTVDDDLHGGRREHSVRDLLLAQTLAHASNLSTPVLLLDVLDAAARKHLRARVPVVKVPTTYNCIETNVQQTIKQQRDNGKRSSVQQLGVQVHNEYTKRHNPGHAPEQHVYGMCDVFVLLLHSAYSVAA